MARSKVPSPLERRHLLERQLSPAHATRIAEAYLTEGRVGEAVEFLRKAGAQERLEELRQRALEEGELFQMRSIAAAANREPSPEEWQALADAATAAGKLLYAEQARRLARRGEV